MLAPGILCKFIALIASEFDVIRWYYPWCTCSRAEQGFTDAFPNLINFSKMKFRSEVAMTLTALRRLYEYICMSLSELETVTSVERGSIQ